MLDDFPDDHPYKSLMKNALDDQLGRFAKAERIYSKRFRYGTDSFLGKTNYVKKPNKIPGRSRKNVHNYSEARLHDLFEKRLRKIFEEVPLSKRGAEVNKLGRKMIDDVNNMFKNMNLPIRIPRSAKVSPTRYDNLVGIQFIFKKDGKTYTVRFHEPVVAKGAVSESSRSFKYWIFTVERHTKKRKVEIEERLLPSGKYKRVSDMTNIERDLMHIPVTKLGKQYSKNVRMAFEAIDHSRKVTNLKKKVMSIADKKTSQGVEGSLGLLNDFYQIKKIVKEAEDALNRAKKLQGKLNNTEVNKAIAKAKNSYEAAKVEINKAYRKFENSLSGLKKKDVNRVISEKMTEKKELQRRLNLARKANDRAEIKEKIATIDSEIKNLKTIRAKVR